MIHYDLNQPEHYIVNQVMKRFEDYFLANGIEVVIGDKGRAIIEDLIFQYGLELTKQYDEIGHLSIELDKLRK